MISRNYFVSLITLFICSTSVLAQQKMLMKKENGKYNFYVEGKDANRLDQKRTLRSVIDILDDSAKAAEFAQKAKTNYDAGMFLSVIGGAMVGWEIGKAIGGGEINAGVIGLGGVILLATIPLASGFKTNINKSISIYNSENSSISELNLKLGFQNNGIGVSVNFK